MEKKARGILSGVLAAVLATLAITLAVAAPAPASAVEVGAGGLTRPDKPAGSQRWGYSYLNAPPKQDSGTGVVATGVGGWQGGPYFVSRYVKAFSSGYSLADPMRFLISEPQISTGSTTTQKFWSLSLAAKGIVDNRSGTQRAGYRLCQNLADCQTLDSRITTVPVVQSRARCSDTEWTASANVRILRVDVNRGDSTTGYGNDVNWGSFAVSLPMFGTTTTQLRAEQAGGCRYLISMEFNACYYPINSGSASAVCKAMYWGAEEYFKGTNDKGYDPGDLTTDLCSADITVSPECPFVNPDTDGTNFEQVCGNPPAMEWLSWSWVPPTIGHYTRCLFQPANGWDRGGDISAAYEDSALSAIAASVDEAAHAFDIPETCGRISGSGSGIWSSVDLNTCNWDWAGQLKTFIGWAVVLYGGYSILLFVIRTITGVVNRKSVEPVEADD